MNRDDAMEADVDNLPALIRRAIRYADREAEAVALGMMDEPPEITNGANAYTIIEAALKAGLKECEEHHHHTCEWITPEEPSRASYCRICGRNGDA
jgi:hypothetical protein